MLMTVPARGEGGEKARGSSGRTRMRWERVKRYPVAGGRKPSDGAHVGDWLEIAGRTVICSFEPFSIDPKRDMS